MSARAVADIRRCRSFKSGARVERPLDLFTVTTAASLDAAAMDVGVRPCLRFVFPHICMRGREKFGFRIRRRDPDVARAGSGALGCRRTDKADYRQRQNYAVVYSA